MKVLTIAAGTSGNIKLSYTPEFIGIKVNATAVLGRITGTREGTGTLLNLDGTGVTVLGQSMRATENATGTTLLIPCADGFVNGGFFLEASNTGLSTIDIFAFSTKKGTAFVSSIIDTAVANTSTRYEKFLKLACGTGTNAADIITHFYNLDESNTAVLVTYDEVKAVEAINFNNNNAGTSDAYISWDNTDQSYKAVVLQPTNNVTMYLQRIVS
jgi:hypothetical protein